MGTILSYILQKISFSKADLESEPFYHGICSLDDLKEHLTNEGDWLVRASDSKGKVDLVLHVFARDEVNSFRIVMLKEGYALNYLAKKAAIDPSATLPIFQTVRDLADYYGEHRLPNNIRLGKAIYRPPYLIPHSWVVYKEEGLMGTGNFGKVYKGKFCPPDGYKVDVAIKLCTQTAGVEDQKLTREQRQASRERARQLANRFQMLGTRQAMIREAKILSRFKHPHVVKLIAVACNHPPVLLLLEMCNGGSLDLHVMKGGICATEKILYCYEAALGIEYIHLHHCIHRDIAARNLLISSDGLIKVADFGLSKVWNEHVTLKEDLQSRPFRYLAPEAMTDQSEYSRATDVWAFGVTIYEIFTNGHVPHETTTFKGVVQRIRAGRMPTLSSAEAPPSIANMLRETWAFEPNARPDFTRLVTNLHDILATYEPLDPDDMAINKNEKNVRRKHFISEETKTAARVTTSRTKSNSVGQSSQSSLSK